ncbi:hypothetical protein FBR06_08125 [Betaproteobacteria bacterium PRO4]|uniref:hypothetical protein n=1 Tax=Nitrosomonas sp. TaxID=42353 RepID=UPI0025682521|nr:hypothetical protein [Nitrosomonas sp.]MBE7526888.1 hypothetical protein [Burkholderiales bacterium]MDL1867189.1 hypothetical protein [Betaproteobacteria bacterium PRO4]
MTIAGFFTPYFLVEKISRKWQLLYSRAGVGVIFSLLVQAIRRNFVCQALFATWGNRKNKKGAEGLMLVKIGVK